MGTHWALCSPMSWRTLGLGVVCCVHRQTAFPRRSRQLSRWQRNLPWALYSGAVVRPGWRPMKREPPPTLPDPWDRLVSFFRRLVPPGLLARLRLGLHKEREFQR